jgi:O-antigen ligase
VGAGAGLIPRPQGSGELANVLEKPEVSSALHKVGLYAAFLYLFSGFANDIGIHFLHVKPYLSIVAAPLLVIAFFLCGSATRGLKTPLGRIWLALTAFMIGASVFSIVHATSLQVTREFIMNSLACYFYISAFAVTIRNCGTIMVASVVFQAIYLLTCVFLGKGDDVTRFIVPGSSFMGNSNDIGLQMVVSIGFCLYIILYGNAIAKIIGVLEFAGGIYFLVKTGTRGGFLAVAACALVWMIVSPAARKVLLIMVVPAVCLVIAAPGSMVSRLVKISAPGSLAGKTNLDANEGSQQERTYLLQQSLLFSLRHPVFGSGPGTFMDSLWHNDVATNARAHVNGTHNTYTQLSSESGIPVALLYIAALVISIRMNYRVMVRTRGSPNAKKVHMMATGLFGTLIGFGISVIFIHVGYDNTLPLYSALSGALYLASRGGDPQWIEAQLAAGTV